MVFESLYLALHKREFDKELATYGDLPKTTVVTIGRQSYRVSLDWEGISELVKAKITRPDPKIYGGLLNNWKTPSFSSCSDECDLIVVNPGHLAVRRYLSAFRNPLRQLHRRTTMLLSHELGHLFQQHRGYGWISCLVFAPVCLSAPIIVPACLFLALAKLIPWSVLAIAIGCLWFVFQLYRWHPQEHDANEYARDNWREWAPFVHVEKLEQ